jgi:hypothetical protein
VKLTETLARLDRAQRSRGYKIIASAAVVLLALASFIALVVVANEPGNSERVLRRAAERARSNASGLVIEQGPLTAAQRAIDALLLTIRPLTGEENAPPEPAAGSSPEGTDPAAAGAPQTDVPASAAAPAPEAEPERDRPRNGVFLVAGVFAIVTGSVLAVIWLGLSLTYLALLTLGWGVAWPLMLSEPTAQFGTMLIGITPLLLAFLTGMELLRLALSGPWPVVAVARNVLQEAVRMKISLVFIVMLLLMLAYVPGSLNESQPLRYRVQQWLQFGTGLSYAVLALLTLFLSAATIAFEQRERIIWQTMTKPVAPWQYLLGKWLGVMSLNVVLLSVTAGGVFLFTEYLRHQPAQGELTYQVRNDGVPTTGRPDLMTDDRRLLETQVLVARRGSTPEKLFSDFRLERAVDDRIARMREQDSTVQDNAQLRDQIRSELAEQREAAVQESIDRQVREMIDRDPTTRDTLGLREQLREEVLTAQELRYRTIPLDALQTFWFTGLESVAADPVPRAMTLRYKINSGTNNPSFQYRLLFVIGGQPVQREVALKTAQVLTFDSRLVQPDGTLRIDIYAYPENQREIIIPDDGLEVLYIAGGYELNFLRILLVMWVKLGFIAAVAASAATFTSFPVACLVAMTVMISAETAGFLWSSLDYYVSLTKEGVDYVAVLVRMIAVPIALLFKSYAELKPTANLVDGRLVGWGQLIGTLVMLGSWTFFVLAAGWAIFRKRELATYSGR